MLLDNAGCDRPPRLGQPVGDCGNSLSPLLPRGLFCLLLLFIGIDGNAIEYLSRFVDKLLLIILNINLLVGME